MKRITSESEVEDVMKQIGVGEGEELRESSKRKNTLEKLAQLRSRNPDTTLTLDNTHTAFVEVEEDFDEFRNITVTSRKFEQQITTLPEDYFDYLVQRAMACHEVGHILYSSWPALQKYMNKVEEEENVDTEQYLLMFKHFVNVLEDGAIENFLRESFRVEEELLALRATLHESHYMGKEYDVEGKGKEYHYPFFFAVMTAALNLGVYDNGEIWKLLDKKNDQHFFAKRGGEYDQAKFQKEVLPEIRKYIPKIQEERDAEKRMKICYELWDFIRDYIDNSVTPGKAEYQREQESSEGDSYVPGVPENLSESHGDQQETPIIVQQSSSANEQGDQGQPNGSCLGEERGDRMQEIAEGDQQGSSTELEKKAEKGIIAETKQMGNSDWSDEIQEIINALGAGSGTDELIIAEGGEVLHSRKQQAKRHGRRCERVFRRSLKELQRDRIQRDRRRGHLDNRKMIDADRGSTRIFQKVKKGDKKDYRCMLVLDRSGSMSSRIDEVELAAGSVAYGLEANGIDTSILDTHSNKTTLSKPFGTEVDDFANTIFANRTGGGTPLTHTMNFARKRMKRGKGKIPFAIVVTDGRPSSVESFKEEVKNANFPVLGLYLTRSRSGVEDQLALYDRAVAVESGDDVEQKIINLIRGVLF